MTVNRIYYQQIYNSDDFEVLVEGNIRNQSKPRRIALCAHQDDAKEIVGALARVYLVPREEPKRAEYYEKE